jgi:multicomponent K+:H+ antiporter subunit E
MTRWAPSASIFAGLLVLWLLFNQTVSPGHILLGSAAAIVGQWLLRLLKLPELRMRRPAVALRLVGMVLADIVRSNIAVGRIVLGMGARERKPGFVDIPLELRNPYGLAALACIITSTPGTLWVNHDPASGVLSIHVLDLIDDDEWIQTIKHRYERALMEIFP